MKNNRENCFTQVNYRRFRQMLTYISLGDTGDHGTDTFIFDQAGKVRAVMQAASIDRKGRCHPSRYYINNAPLIIEDAVAA
tara:strand:- start:1079 stop:1321 length:243 start_codon:yes stop_codon:yes gene_type:complete